MFFDKKKLPRGAEDNSGLKYLYFYGMFCALSYKFYWMECETNYVSRYRYYRWCYPLLNLFYHLHESQPPFFNLKQDVNSWHEKGLKIKSKHRHLLHTTE